MEERFGSAIYLVGMLHLVMLAGAFFSLWTGYRVRFKGEHRLVRDAQLNPIVNGAPIADRYGISYLASGTMLTLLCIATPLGLPFGWWIMTSISVVCVQMIYRMMLESEAGRLAKTVLGDPETD
jgi:hypothetical protein